MIECPPSRPAEKLVKRTVPYPDIPPLRWTPRVSPFHRRDGQTRHSDTECRCGECIAGTRDERLLFSESSMKCQRPGNEAANYPATVGPGAPQLRPCTTNLAGYC